MKTISFTSILLLWLSTLLTAQPEMVPLRGGAFQMGNTKGDADEKPVHRVVLGSFYIARTETTFSDFKTFVDSTGYRTDAERSDGSYVWDSLGWHKREGVHWRHDERGSPRPRSSDRYPVIHVSWNDAAQYCNWLSDREGLTKAYDFQGDSIAFNVRATGYRLPTEAEWEYAASDRSSSALRTLQDIAWYAGNTVRGPKPVGLKNANSSHLYDMAGNVWEWCHDWYSGNTYKNSTDSKNPNGPAAGKERCVRGGSWNNNAAHCRATNRTCRFPDFRDGSIGFRVVRR